jgi:hypothetical protein
VTAHGQAADEDLHAEALGADHCQRKDGSVVALIDDRG